MTRITKYITNDSTKKGTLFDEYTTVLEGSAKII